MPGSLAALSTADGRPLHVTEVFSERAVAALSGLSFSEDGSLLVLVGGGAGAGFSDTGFLLLMAAGDGVILSSKLAPWVRDFGRAVLSPDGQLLATFASLGGTTIWRMSDVVPVFDVHTEWPSGVFLSNNELASGETGGTVARWCLPAR
jgi:WD40 repeat protein